MESWCLMVRLEKEAFIHSFILSLSGHFGARPGASNAEDQRTGRRGVLSLIHTASGS